MKKNAGLLSFPQFFDVDKKWIFCEKCDKKWIKFFVV